MINKMEFSRSEIQLLEYTAKTLKKLGIKPRKQLGQNFLISENYRDRILNLIEPSATETIIEIGGGLGALTFPLAEMKSNLVVYELDDNLRDFLNDEIHRINPKAIILGDFLKEYPPPNLQDRKFKIIGNIPYRITSPILEKIYDCDVLPSETILMVQREFAERITAKPPSSERGRITIWCEYHAEISECFNVRKGSFYPSPEVVSKVIKLKTRSELPLDTKQKMKFFGMVKISFSMKRKTLTNNLAVYRKDMKKNEIESMIEDVGLKKSVRAEALSIQQFIRLFKTITSL